jgi:hypothetical protein
VSVSSALVFESLLVRFYASRPAGPFSRAALAALIRGRCQKCDATIGDNALLGNALVIAPGAVEVLCRHCRGGGDTPDSIPGTRAGLRKAALVRELKRRRCVYTGMRLDWLSAINCLRCGLAYFQKSSELEPSAAFRSDRFWLPYYGNGLLLGNCAECGALWSTEEVESDDAPGAEFVGRWDEAQCWRCGLPHALQWHMRSTAAQEQALLSSAP